jgi:hypothetical protein
MYAHDHHHNGNEKPHGLDALLGELPRALHSCVFGQYAQDFSESSGRAQEKGRRPCVVSASASATPLKPKGS